ncbi:hypothetical protein BDN67DRAFT_824156 [Paxillus ammoniavirescens]|nr:hypothetical protein BDN67DRAFT_824156 [Paxillus ammoniavirescens]
MDDHSIRSPPSLESFTICVTRLPNSHPLYRTTEKPQRHLVKCQSPSFSHTIHMIPSHIVVCAFILSLRGLVLIIRSLRVQDVVLLCIQ